MVEKGENETFGRDIIDRKRRLWYNDSGLGRFRGGALLFRSGPKRNDPWRFRQQSSRVISVQFWYLTSWLPHFLLDQTPCSQWLIAKLVSFRRIFGGSVLALIILGALCLPVHWYHLFVSV